MARGIRTRAARRAGCDRAGDHRRTVPRGPRPCDGLLGADRAQGSASIEHAAHRRRRTRKAVQKGSPCFSITSSTRSAVCSAPMANPVEAPLEAREQALLDQLRRDAAEGVGDPPELELEKETWRQDPSALMSRLEVSANRLSARRQTVYREVGPRDPGRRA